MAAQVTRGRGRQRAVVSQHPTKAQQRAAAVTTADHAIKDGWVDQLPDVLDMLGLENAKAAS